MSGLSGLEAAGIVFASISLLSTIAKYVASAGVRYRHARFGYFWGNVFYFSRLIDTDALQQRHWDINAWTDDEVINWKSSHLASCNAIAVAGAIFASIGITALQLPHMDTVHWSARACCVASMLLGVASVTTATKQHQAIGMLKSPLDVRLWLSRGKPTLYRPVTVTQSPNKPATDAGIDLDPERSSKQSRKYMRTQGFENLPLESSISGIKAIALPRHLLDLAVMIFLVGIGLYQLFCWLFNAGEDGIGYRNIFIVLIITLGLSAIYDLAVKTARVTDDKKRNAEFETRTLGGYRRPEELQQLERQLAAVRQRVTLEARKDQIFARYNEAMRRRIAREDHIWREWEQELEHRLARKPAVLAEVTRDYDDQDEESVPSPPTADRAAATQEPSLTRAPRDSALSNNEQEASH